jgi:hypothetical protein
MKKALGTAILGIALMTLVGCDEVEYFGYDFGFGFPIFGGSFYEPVYYTYDEYYYDDYYYEDVYYEDVYYEDTYYYDDWYFFP